MGIVPVLDGWLVNHDICSNPIFSRSPSKTGGAPNTVTLRPYEHDERDYGDDANNAMSNGNKGVDYRCS